MRTHFGDSFLSFLGKFYRRAATKAVLHEIHSFVISFEILIFQSPYCV